MADNNAKFKFVNHTADVEFLAYGKTLGKCFENSALAMFRSMYHEKIKPVKKIKIKVKGKDVNSLLYNFLEELLVLLDSKNFFISKISVNIDLDKLTLEGEVYGDNAGKYNISLYVKAVTYNHMEVKKVKDLWRARVVLDV